MKKLLALVLCVLCVFSVCACNAVSTKTDVEKIAEKNTKAIVGTWIVESIEKGKSDTFADFGVSVATNMLFSEGREVQFLSNGSFTSGIYNLKYELVDNQFIYTYEDQTYAYDCEITEGTMVLSTPDVISVTLKLQ